MSSSFRELRVWQEGLKLSIETYRATSEFPKHELYGLGQQMLPCGSFCTQQYR